MAPLQAPLDNAQGDYRAFFGLLRDLPSFRFLIDIVRKRRGHGGVRGLPGAAASFVMAALAAETGRPILWVTPDSHKARERAEALGLWLGRQRVGVLVAQEILPYALLAASREAVHQRMEVLAAAVTGRLAVLLVPAPVMLSRVVPPQVLAGRITQVAVGDELQLDALSRRLAAAGYQRVDQVEAQGQFALRGGIVDLFAPTGSLPVRLEFFGDLLESIRLFDPGTQRSLEQVERVTITPAAELLLDGEARQRLVEALDRELAAVRERKALSLNKLGRLQDRVAEHKARIAAGMGFPGMERYLSLAYPEAPSPAGLLGGDQLLVLEEPRRINEALDDHQRHHVEQYHRLLADGAVLPGEGEAYLTPDQLQAEMGRWQQLHLSEWTSHQTGGPVASFRGRSVPSFRGQWRLFLDELKAWQGSRRRIVVAAVDEQMKDAVTASLADAGIGVDRRGPVPAPGSVAVAAMPLAEGFQLDDIGLTVVSGSDLAGRRPRRPAVRPAAGEPLEHYDDLMEGDYVVHAYHGIGRYLGIRTMEVQGAQGDYLVIQYAGGDRLYVPTDQVDLVQKYVGAEGREPRLSKMGGAEWSRVKERVRASVREMAEELMMLYAARESLQGHAFGPDQPWQQEFENAFPFEETEDQLRATAEIKADMEKPRPADRLLCGDVGFGKTEVALRAAFKAVTEGKQVAILVPTTILAQQHYETVKERMAGFPVNVGLLSRFRTVKEQQQTIDGLRRGTVDIVVGTHRLLQPDVGFKDLGLLIVDEEHRFGVAHKERIKQLKQNVDVLTLTATPIPRTLQMALSGLRDMSVLSTPPQDRQPVQTYVTEYSDGLVQEAIRRELARGGQVFYVHNRVRSIHHVLSRLQKLVPEARIAVGHGQLDEDHLERVMVDFVAGRYDVLLCTTIIESGLDISNANTLIVEDADQLGLAQLYQLRGRVGRSHRLAYAYFTYDRGRILTETAEKRLQAIRDFTELGSGLKLALRDLEIRGAGNILGAEQHGHMVAVGFDMYTQLLAEVVRELKGEKVEQRLKPTVDLGWDAYLPDDYVNDPRRKIEFYKRIERAGDREQLAAIRDELADRYGPLPPPARNLLTLAEIRRRAAGAGVLTVVRQPGGLRLELLPVPPDVLAEIQELGQLPGVKVQTTGGRPVLAVQVPDTDRKKLLETLRHLLAHLRRAVAAEPATPMGAN